MFLALGFKLFLFLAEGMGWQDFFFCIPSCHGAETLAARSSFLHPSFEIPETKTVDTPTLAEEKKQLFALNVDAVLKSVLEIFWVWGDVYRIYILVLPAPSRRFCEIDITILADLEGLLAVPCCPQFLPQDLLYWNITLGNSRLFCDDLVVVDVDGRTLFRPHLAQA